MNAARYALLAMLLAGCPGFGSYGPRIPGGTLLTDNTEIDAEDGSFHIKAGEAFTAPFHVACFGAHKESFKPAPHDYPKALALGAVRVRVIAPGTEEPLYGVLALCTTSDQSSGAAAETYRLQVPAEYVAEALQGATSVVYEQHTLATRWPQGYSNSHHDFSWQLWLSKTALP